MRLYLTFNYKGICFMVEVLIYGGIVVAGLSVLVGLVIIVVMWVSKRRLNERLDKEYGKRQ